MERLGLYVIADKHNINREIYAEFITRRFPKESDIGYLTEWAERFSTGTPEVYMDSQSQAIYRQVVDEFKSKK